MDGFKITLEFLRFTNWLHVKKKKEYDSGLFQISGLVFEIEED